MNSTVMSGTQWFYDGKIVTSPIFNDKNLSIIKKRVLQIFSGLLPRMYLDLGCGSGELALFISSLVNPLEIHGVEVSDSSRERASKLGIKCVASDLNQGIPYPDSSFDVVSAFEIIEHLWNKDVFLKEIFRIMRPGGFLILTTPNLLAFLNRVLMVFGYMPLHYDLSFEYELEKRPFQRTSHLYGHISLYSTNTLRRHLESAGFQVASIDGLSSNYVARFKFLKIINSLVSWRPNLASEILIIARKPLSNS